MKYCFLRYPEGKAKAVTFSFDDGQIYDERLVEIMDRNGLKGTFNLIGDHFLADKPVRVPRERVKTLYFPAGHDVANHGMTHAALINLTPAEGIREVLEGREAAEKFFGRLIRGFVYPDRTASTPQIREYLAMLGVTYARDTAVTGSFALPDDFLQWHPTAKHNLPDALPLAEKFLAEDPRGKYCAQRDSLLYYVWGHSFECPRDDWEGIEKLCALLGGHDDVWYANNTEIYEYVTAYRSLVRSADRSMIYNPTLFTLWFDCDGAPYVIRPGETLVI